MSGIDAKLLKTLLSRLSKGAFQEFIFELYKAPTGREDTEVAQELGEGVLLRHSDESHGIYGGYYAAQVTDFLPAELLSSPRQIAVDTDELVSTLKRIDSFNQYVFRERFDARYLLTQEYSPLQSICFLNNIADFSEHDRANLMAQYHHIGKLYAPYASIGVHNINTFVDQDAARTAGAFRSFIDTYREGIRIHFSTDAAEVNTFAAEKPLFSGVSGESLYPYETLILRRTEQVQVLRDFESLINSNAKERHLEEFLSDNFRLIFDPKFDRIETQLWLRFPELDAFGKSRRLDVFLRNSVINDWELFEIKRATKLTSTYRDSQVLASEVCYAVQQVKHYRQLLAQDKVRQKFEAEGISYFQPSLNLIIGRSPQISDRQFRQLISNEKEVKIITFDELLREMKLRIDDRFRFGN
jgi:hypothetical protein